MRLSDKIAFMFTGIIQAVGQIEKIESVGDDVRLDIAAGSLDLGGVQIGDSIATSGVCLTVIAFDERSFRVHVSKETLSCTVGLDTKKPVNLEEALRLADRLGGHLVSGHVDGVGRVVRFEPVGDCMLLSIRAPHILSCYIAAKGSIAVDGVSLTVNSVDHDTFTINLIPHTLEMTTLRHLGIGSRVNLEVDQVARYVERMAQWQTESQGEPA
jgi:riboflavin synthase